MAENEVFERKKRITQTSEETKAAIVNNSVQALSRSPAKSVAEMQKQFVQPIVNGEGKPSAINEVDRVAKEAEAAMDELAAYVGQYDSRILTIKEAMRTMQETIDTQAAALTDLYEKLPKVKLLGEE